MTLKSILFLLSLWLITSIPFQLMAQDPLIQIGQDAVSDFLNDIFCNYELGVSEDHIESFVSSLIFDSSNLCSPLVPQSTFVSQTAHSFEWNSVPDAIDYTVAVIGLSDGLSKVVRTNKLDHTFDSMSPQTYLMFFITNCLEGSSIASIIITDKDVFFPTSSSFDAESCSCPDNKYTDVVMSNDCPIFTQYYFPWDNDCFGNKYFFNIDNPGAQNDRAFWLLHGEPTGNLSHYVNLLECSDGLVGTQYIDDPGNFWAHFNSNGVHIYITNPNWINPIVSSGICECYEQDHIYDQHDVKHRLSNDGKSDNFFKAWPNPAIDIIQLELNSTEPSQGTITLIDVTGKIWLHSTTTFQKGINNFDLDMSGFPKGLFNVIVDQSGNRKMQRILKI